MTKVLVLFYSTYGTNHGMAQAALEAAEAAGVEARLRRIPETAPQSVIDGQEAWKAEAERQKDIPEVTPDDLEWADAQFWSVPTRYGGMASQARAFIDTLGPLWQRGGMVNATVTGVTSAMNVHGGQETTLMNLYISAMHWGAVIVAPGYADPLKFEDGGNPYGYSKQPGELDETGRKSITFQMNRLIEITRKIRG
ncbi:NAD(P)H-dependent oxidoreductase [Wenxinia marina]|uniref:Multimeric flavodoxin WrbA n=1 Tax=Wenxinia marina DSM 24838 TaxID=1123501 RepID=A0A0D0NRA4_9RHOB|nr:NAD(P)H-dependent oxidoreductase [Wenxinia marina]KIQ70720.1 Multimeric flavodoxin WrbA [Wenxinia marina DSM 24838]GGL51128.1 trp repressor-binding protein WrbA [Wenxinia marina]